MIEYQDQLKLQSYLDGELPTAETREIGERLARDAEAAALLNELRQTKQVLAGFDQAVKVPESREFYWSKISREIQRQEVTEPKPGVVPSWAAKFRRFLMPTTGLAVVGLVALVVTREAGTGPAEPTVETSLADSGAFVFRDSSARATFVYLSYPADNENSEDDDLLFE